MKDTIIVERTAVMKAPTVKDEAELEGACVKTVIPNFWPRL